MRLAVIAGPTINTNTAPGTDMTSFRTFNFLLPLSTDRPGGVRTPLSNMLIVDRFSDVHPTF